MPSATTAEFHTASRAVASRLAETQRRLVLAESCTGGLVAAGLAQVPGVSQVLCGSAVTYRDDTKVRWLGVDAAAIEESSAVSRIVAEQMALGVLSATPEAGIAAAVTGHLGPDAPAGQDGELFIAVACRGSDGPTVLAARHKLSERTRADRQTEAAILVLHKLLEVLDG